MDSYRDPAELDVLIVGAGPAGAATALWLARRGVRVAMVERTRYESMRLGGAMAADVQPLLRELDLWDAFMQLGPQPSGGLRSLWGGTPPQAGSHLLSARSGGWHVDRRAFDRLLTRSAVEAGSLLLEGMAFKSIARHGNAWQVRLVGSEGRGGAGHRSGRTLCARIVVDATGRRAQVGRALGAQRLVFDRLVGVSMQWSGMGGIERGQVLVETAPEGWWYSAPLPGGPGARDGALISMLMTDADLCVEQGMASERTWMSCLHTATASGARLLGAAHPASPLRVHCANSQRLYRSEASMRAEAGPWLAVGDAALAVDPLSGSGVPRALRSAREAADTVAELLVRPDAWQEALTAYESDRDDECTHYLAERARCYAAERRFDTPFWRRRRWAEPDPAALDEDELSEMVALP